MFKAVYHCSDQELDRMDEARFEALLSAAPEVIKILASAAPPV